ncbi:DUF1330 domain-containing protein [Streptomyces xiamenensis]|uniref:DUF1330 domain-containing protein n=1 Tax=Streptomyces xiamenensis TaxID=408015 RepID=UPI0037D2E4A2
MERKRMPAYVIVDVVSMEDQEAALAYSEVAIPSVLAHGGRYVVAGPTPRPVEGSWDSARLVILEFPDLERVRTWYDSPEYTRARELREDAMHLRVLFAEGTTGAPVPPSAPDRQPSP